MRKCLPWLRSRCDQAIPESASWEHRLPEVEISKSFHLQVICKTETLVERENIKQRQAEGIAVAKAKGVHFGRHPLPIPIGFEEIAGQYLRREITAVQASRMLEVSCSTFQRWLQKAREDGSLTADIGRLLDRTEVQRVE